MTNLTFVFGENNLRVEMVNNEPWFVNKDACSILGIKKYRDALVRIDEDEKSLVTVQTNGGKQKLTAVNEYGLYNLIFMSRKKEARDFKRWVTHEVLPSIRKDGGYMVVKEGETDADIMARALLIAKSTIERKDKLLQEKEQILIEQQPKVILANAITANKDSIRISELAKIITQAGYTIGQNKLFDWMRVNGYLGTRGDKRNEPMQRYIEQGLFEIDKYNFFDQGEVERIAKTVKVTGKGQEYFINKFIIN